MNKPGAMQTEEIPKVDCSLRPLIQSFYERLSGDQWALLKRGCPDDATTVLIAELILDIVSTLSKVLLKAVRNTNVVVTEKGVQACLGDTLSQSFSEALDLKEQVKCDSSEILKDLILKEVTLSVNSALSTSVGSAESVITECMTSPGRLDRMVGDACKTFKAFTAKMKRRLRACWHRRRQTSSQEPLETMELTETDDPDSPVPSVELETSEKQVSSEDSAIEVQSLTISRGMSELIDPLLEDVSDDEYELLMSEHSLQTEAIAKEVAQSLSDIKSLEETAPTGSSSTPRQKQKLLKGIKEKIKSFSAKRFAKALILRLASQLKSKFRQDFKAASRTSLQTFTEDVESLLTQDEGKPQGGKELCVFDKLTKISSGKNPKFTLVLSNLIFSYITDGMQPEIVPEQIKNGTSGSETCPAHATMYDEIKDKVKCFLRLMGWWLNTQSSSHSKNIALALTGSGSLATPQLPEPTHIQDSPALTAAAVVSDAHVETHEEPAQDSQRKESLNKVCLRMMVENLVLRLQQKAELKTTPICVDLKAINERLVELTWSELQGVDVDVTPDTLKSLHKSICKDLRQKWGNAEMVLVLLETQDPAIEHFIASSVTVHLTRPPKRRSAICRFFSSVGRTISNICRRRRDVV